MSVINSKLWRELNLIEIPLKYYESIKSTSHWKNDEPTDAYKRANIVHYYGTYIKGKPFHNEFAIHPD